MNAAPLPSLGEHLARQHAALATFVALLEREQALLCQAPVPIDELDEATQRKRALADELEQLETCRQQINAANGYGHDAAASRALAERESCLELWNQFVVRVESARAHNQASGAAVNAQLELTNQTLAFLRAQADTGLYTRSGQKLGYAVSKPRSGA